LLSAEERALRLLVEKLQVEAREVRRAQAAATLEAIRLRRQRFDERYAEAVALHEADPSLSQRALADRLGKRRIYRQCFVQHHHKD
jgi:hypothetical protein